MREEPERSDGVVAEPGFATLVVHVHWADDGTPAASVGVMAAPQPECRVREREGVTSSDGTLVLRHLRPGACTVRAMFSPSQELALADGQVTVIDFKARRAGVASGTVVNDRGQVIAGARIWVSAFDGPWRGFEVARSDASGRFSVPCVPRMCVGARKAGYAPSRLIEVTETTPQLELTLAGPGGTVRGRVVDTEHRALAAAVVEIGWKGGWVVPTGATGVSAVMATAPMLTTDERGEFSFEGVAPGDIGVRAWADGCAPVEERVLVEARQTASVEVVLPRGAIVEGAVRDTRGDVVAGATVERSGAYFDFARSRTLTDARGAFRLENLPLGTVALEVDSRSGGVRATIVTAAGGVSPWNPVVGAAGARLEGRVVGPHGEPLAELFVGIVAGNTPAATNTTGTDAKGTFAFDDLAQKTVDLLIESSQGQLARRKDVPVGAEPIVVTLSADELPSVHVRGRVRDSEGKPIAASVVLMNRAFGMGQGVTTRADGTFDRGPIAAGVYSLEVDARGFGHVPIDCLTLHAGEERMLPDIVLARAGRVQLELRDLGQPMCQLKIVRDDGVTMTWVMSEGARATAELPPGSYTAATQLGNRRIGSVAFRVRSGETVAATIAFVTGNDVAVECRTGPMPASSTVLVLVRDVAGTLVDIAEFHMLHQKGDEASNWTCSLVAGQYQIEARASDGRTAIANVTVRDGGEKPRVVLDLTAGH
jgi:protocatechuate 3,4-dioxygenase beta subunit